MHVIFLSRNLSKQFSIHIPNNKIKELLKLLSPKKLSIFELL